MGKKAIAFISVVSNTLLTLLKLVAGVITGSVSLLSEGLHSFGDLFASLIAFGSVVESAKPADKEHPMGHGKFEDMAGFIEAWLIILSAFFILYIGFEKIISKNVAHTFHADAAVYIMFFSVLVNFIVASILLKKGKETDSSALEGDGHHLMADVYSSLAVALGLLAVKITGHYILDPIIAIMVGTMILRTGISLVKKTGSSLLDSSLPDENLNVINKVLNSYKQKGILEVKSIRTYKSGNIKNIILIIYLDCMTTLKDAHKLMDEIENSIEAGLKNTNIIIHAEPKIEAPVENKTKVPLS